jgi:hypothetical protein
MNMCKFTDSSDIGYQRISGHIISFVKQAVHDDAQGEQTIPVGPIIT